MKRSLVLVFFLAGCATGPQTASSDATANRMREVVHAHGPAVVTVQLVVEEQFSIGFLGNEASESVMETTATVISPDGLIVTSLSATNPGGMFRDMFEMMGDEALGFEMNFDTQIKEVTIVLESGEELPGRFVLRDRDLDLAFIRPEEPPAKPLASVSLDQDGKLHQFDRVLLMERMGKVADRAVTANVTRVASLLETPRLYYVLSDVAVDMPGSGIGLPAFDMEGRYIGMTIFRNLELGRPFSLSMLGNMESNTALVIVPARDMRDSADQAPGYEEE